LRDALAAYVRAGRRVSGGSRRPARGGRREIGERAEYYGGPRVSLGAGHRGGRSRAGTC
jgi:hypothetical protein